MMISTSWICLEFVGQICLKGKKQIVIKNLQIKLNIRQFCKVKVQKLEKNRISSIQPTFLNPN